MRSWRVVFFDVAVEHKYISGVDMNTSKLVEGGAGPETTQTLKEPRIENRSLLM